MRGVTNGEGNHVWRAGASVGGGPGEDACNGIWKESRMWDGELEIISAEEMQPGDWEERERRRGMGKAKRRGGIRKGVRDWNEGIPTGGRTRGK